MLYVADCGCEVEINETVPQTHNMRKTCEKHIGCDFESTNGRLAVVDEAYEQARVR